MFRSDPDPTFSEFGSGSDRFQNPDPIEKKTGSATLAGSICILIPRLPALIFTFLLIYSTISLMHQIPSCYIKHMGRPERIQMTEMGKQIVNLQTFISLLELKKGVRCYHEFEL